MATVRHSLYDALGIPRNASTEDVKKAYKKVAVKCHPDKGGDAYQFQRVAEAHQVLSDPEQRQLYDQLGDELYQRHAQDKGSAGNPFGDMSAFDVFAHMFGGAFSGPPAQEGPSRTVHACKVDVTLEDAYRGVQKRIKVTEERPCKACEVQCTHCAGMGFRTTIMQMGFMAQMSQMPCGPCGAKGVIYSKGRGCRQCMGTASIKDVKTVSVQIPPGIETNAQVSVPVSDTCELSVRILVTEHATLKRQGNDLVHNVTLSFQEAVLGRLVQVPHFDGPVAIDTASMGIIRHGQEHVIHNKGMPILSQGYTATRGNLIVRFSVEPLVYNGGKPVILPSSVRAMLADAFMQLGRVVAHVQYGGDPEDNVI